MKMQVKDNPTLVRDPNTMAILNTSIDAVAINEKRRKEIEQKMQQKEEINTLKKEVSDIKGMLQQILERI